MVNLRRLGCGLLLAVAVTACNSAVPRGESKATESSSAAASRPADVTLTVVKWPELERAIASRQGNVVVLDVWAEY